MADDPMASQSTAEGDAGNGPTNEQHDWVHQVCGIDPRSYGACQADPTPPEAAQPPEGSGVITLPEITITGSPDPSPSTAAAAPLAAPAVAAAALPIVTPGAPGPGGAPYDPSIVDGQPWSPIQSGASTTTGGSEAAATGTEAATTGAEVAATGTEAAVTGAEAGVVATETGVGLTAAEGIGVGAAAAGVGAVALGVVAVAAAGYGVYKLGEWLAEPSNSTSDPKAEDPGDPDNPNSGHGEGGAPEQTASNPTAQPSGNYDPAKAPGAGPVTPAIDPGTSPPAIAPGSPDANPTPGGSTSVSDPPSPDGHGPTKMNLGDKLEEFYDIEDAAKHAINEDVAEVDDIGSIGKVKNTRIKEGISNLGYDPDEFNAHQYKVVGSKTNKEFIITVFEAEGVYIDPHISSSN